MFGLDTLDVGIGMALMFLFVSLICSAVREFGEALFKTRASSLERGIMDMFGEGPAPLTATARVRAVAAWIRRRFSRQAPAPPRQTPVTDAFYQHAQIAALFRGEYKQVRPRPFAQYIPWLGRNRLPSYIPAESFARTILQIARHQADHTADRVETVARLRYWIDRRNDHGGQADAWDGLRQALQIALDTGDDDLARTEEHLTQWFNGVMDRVAGWYTRRTTIWLFVLGLGCAVMMNVDAITVMKTLATDRALRDTVAGAAGRYLARCADPDGAPVDAATADAPGLADGRAAAAVPLPCPPAATAGATLRVPEPSGDKETRFEEIRTAAAQMSDVSWPIGWSDDWLPAPQERLLVADRRAPAASPGTHPEPPDLPGLTPGLVRWPVSLILYALRLAGWLLRNQAMVIVGWLVTAFGVTFGASFWFDVLNRFMVVRSTIKPDEKSPREPSKS